MLPILDLISEKNVNQEGTNISVYELDVWECAIYLLHGW